MNSNIKITVTFDRALLFILVAFCLWRTYFSDTPLLRRACIYFMQWSFRRIKGQENIEESQNLIDVEA